MAKWAGWIKRLSDARAERVHDACEQLGELLGGSGKWKRDAAPALNALMRTLPEVKADLGSVVLLIADLVGADHRAALHPKAKAPPKAVVAAVSNELDALLSLASSDDGTARAGFAQIAATVPALGDRTRPVLEALSRDLDPIVRTSAVLALGALGDESALTTALARASVEDAGVRGAVALVELLRRPKLKLADRADALSGWLGFRRPTSGTEFLWFAKHGGSDVVAPLLAIAEHRKQKDQLVDLLITHTGPGTVEAASELVIQLGKLDKLAVKYVGYVALPDELDQKQRAIAERLVDSDLVPLGAFGITAPGATRRRWLGLDPPGPSERRVEARVGRKKYAGPLWRVWQDMHRDDDALRYVIPEALADALDAVDRWHVLIERAAKNYGGWHFDPDLVDPTIQQVKGATGLRDRAEQLAGELLRRFRPAIGVHKLLRRLDDVSR